MRVNLLLLSLVILCNGFGTIGSEVSNNSPSGTGEEIQRRGLWDDFKKWVSCPAGNYGDTCYVGCGCKSGLSCQPGIPQRCYSSPRLFGEPCSLFFGCKSGLSCAAVENVCTVGNIKECNQAAGMMALLVAGSAAAPVVCAGTAGLGCPNYVSTLVQVGANMGTNYLACQEKAAERGLDLELENPMSLMPEDFKYHARKCVYGSNLNVYTDKTIKECAALCSSSACKGFEYGQAYGARSSEGWNPRDCILQSSKTISSCDGTRYNVDFFEKV